MVIVKHLVYLGLLTFSGSDASWVWGRQQRGQDEINVRDTLAQFFARSPQGHGGGGGHGGGAHGGGGGRGGGGGGGGGGHGGGGQHGGPVGHGGGGQHGGPGGNGDQHGGPVGHGPPIGHGGPAGGGGPILGIPPYDPGEYEPGYPPYPPGYIPRPLRTTTISVGSVGYTSTIFTTDAYGRPTRFVVVAVPTIFSPTSSSPTLSFPTTTPAPLETITVTAGSIPFTSTLTTTGANGLPTGIVVVNVPTIAPLQTITRTRGSFPFTETLLTTDAVGLPTSVVVVSNPSGIKWTCLAEAKALKHTPPCLNSH
ncbi:hypothetical protein PMIN06_003820 [Paraphaeosphaeria minitans]